MRLGSSIFLIALGAILAFAVSASISGIDLQVVGYILLAVGVLARAGSVTAEPEAVPA